jgi:hypothetical protein
MARSREGNGRHRQVKIEAICPDCGGTVMTDRPSAARPNIHIPVHFDGDGFLCPPFKASDPAHKVLPPKAREPQFPGQGVLFADVA